MDDDYEIKNILIMAKYVDMMLCNNEICKHERASIEASYACTLEPLLSG